MLFFLYYFSRFYKTKTRPYITNLRHSLLDQNVGYIYRKCQLSICHSKRDIDVQKIKVYCILGFVTCISLYLFL